MLAANNNLGFSLLLEVLAFTTLLTTLNVSIGQEMECPYFRIICHDIAYEATFFIFWMDHDFEGLCLSFIMGQFVNGQFYWFTLCGTLVDWIWTALMIFQGYWLHQSSGYIKILKYDSRAKTGSHIMFGKVVYGCLLLFGRARYKMGNWIW